MSLRALCLITLAAFTLAGCKTKSSATIYRDDGPSVHYHEAESAGGAIRTQRYR